jgi:predicted nucleic acid-binding protein
MPTITVRNVPAKVVLGARTLGGRIDECRVDGRARGRAASERRACATPRRLGIESVATAPLCQGALLRSIATGIPADDTLFVQLAARAACPLVTFDKALLKAFPGIAIRPRELT